MSAVKEIVLTFSCQDSKGLVAAVATLFATLGFNIKESSQFEDVQSNRFFIRTVTTLGRFARCLSRSVNSIKWIGIFSIATPNRVC
jgi:formyltetrahydrofolate hydrolase